MLEIYLDVDGVLYNINKHAISIANEEFHTNYDYTDNTSWWWDDYTKETGFANREYFYCTFTLQFQTQMIASLRSYRD